MTRQPEGLDKQLKLQEKLKHHGERPTRVEYDLFLATGNSGIAHIEHHANDNVRFNNWSLKSVVYLAP